MSEGYSATVVEPVAPLVLDILEAAALLRCGRSTLYELIASGDLTGVKIGRRHLVTYASCAALVERLSANPDA